MELPVLIEPLPNQGGFIARLAAPLHLTAQAATAQEARQQVVALLQARLQQGAQLDSITVPRRPAVGLAGWLPDDDLTLEWLQWMQQYRSECDEADRRRILSDDQSENSA